MSYTYAKREQPAQATKAAKAPQAQETARSVAAASGAAAADAHRVDLPDAMRAKMENAFGADLSAVKLYESQAVADAGAQAVTRGSDIAFAPGMLDFTSYSGQALLGHEMSHVVSQARGEVTGSGFLNDHALEARADREGAMAAAGQQVYAGPVAAPLSGATASAAAGPMQARKDGGMRGGHIGRRALHLDSPNNDNDPRSRDQKAHDQAIESQFMQTNGESELAQDVDWDMGSDIKKRGWWSRNVGKHFYKNDSAKNVFKNIGVGAAMPLILMGDLAKKGWKKLKRSNQDAVDQFNNYDEDYKKMSGWDKFKSFASSPIAWMTAGRRKKGTEERNARRKRIEAAAELWRSNNASFRENTDANFDALNEIPDEAVQQDPGGQSQTDSSGAGTLSTLTGLASMGAMSSDSASYGLAAASSALGAIGAGITANNQRKIGDKFGAASAGLTAAGATASAISSAAGTTLGVATQMGSTLALNPALNAAVPVFGILSGIANTMSGAVQTGDATSTRMGMTESMKELGDPKKLNRDQQRMRNTFEQAHGVAKADQTEGIMRSIGGVMETTGNAMTLTGAGALPGMIVAGLGTTLGAVGSMVGSSKRDSVGEDQLEKDAQFTKQVEVVRRRFKNLNLSTREAKQVVLQSMGMYSGDKKEAVQNMTMRRAYEMTKAANDEQDPNHAIASKGIARMGLSRVDGNFSLQAVAQKLGFAKDKSWQDQMKETKNQGVYYNPFKDKAKNP